MVDRIQATAISGSEAIDLLRTSSLSQVVQGEIEKIILSGVFAPGEKLNEKVLAERLGVSRGPVREAFQGLHARGLVEMIPNRGVFVQQITRHDAVAIYEVRAGLFGTACRLLAERITSVHVAELRALVARMDVAGAQRDLDAYFPLNLDFHGSIVNGTGNAILARTYFTQVSRLQLFRARGLVQVGAFASSNAEHRLILDALDARDPRAAFEAGFTHVLGGRARTIVAGDTTESEA